MFRGCLRQERSTHSARQQCGKHLLYDFCRCRPDSFQRCRNDILDRVCCSCRNDILDHQLNFPPSFSVPDDHRLHALADQCAALFRGVGPNRGKSQGASQPPERRTERLTNMGRSVF